MALQFGAEVNHEHVQTNADQRLQFIAEHPRLNEVPWWTFIFLFVRYQTFFLRVCLRIKEKEKKSSHKGGGCWRSLGWWSVGRCCRQKGGDQSFRAFLQLSRSPLPRAEHYRSVFTDKCSANRKLQAGERCLNLSSCMTCDRRAHDQRWEKAGKEKTWKITAAVNHI